MSSSLCYTINSSTISMLQFRPLETFFLKHVLQNYHKITTVLVSTNNGCWKYIVVSSILHHLLFRPLMAFPEAFYNARNSAAGRRPGCVRPCLCGRARGTEHPNEGQHIEYEIEENRGKTSAVNLKVK